MSNYGLYPEGEGLQTLKLINDRSKAIALLRLLDLTIGSSDNARVPFDLPDALGRVATVASSLQRDPAFRRLSAITRR